MKNVLAATFTNTQEDVFAAIARIKEINPTAWVQFIKHEHRTDSADAEHGPELARRLEFIMFSRPLSNAIEKNQLSLMLSSKKELAIIAMKQMKDYGRVTATPEFPLAAMEVLRRVKFLFEPYNEVGNRMHITDEFLKDISCDVMHSALYGALPYTQYVDELLMFFDLRTFVRCYSDTFLPTLSRSN